MKIDVKYFCQCTDYSCGPSSLRMVFEHLGKHYSEKELIELCKANPKFGTSHKHLIDEVKNEKFYYIEKIKGKIEDLVRFVENGYLIIVNYLSPLSECGHYAVVCGHNDEDKVLIFADPANGADFSLDYDEFTKRWHNQNSSSKGWFLVVSREEILF